MSWLGGLNDSFNQLSSLTGQIGGQITSFTKDVLTEDSEENLDSEAEATKLKQELLQHKTLVTQLEQENSLLKDKVRRAELQVGNSSFDTEASRQEYIKEINELKQKLAAYGDKPLIGFQQGGFSAAPHGFSSISLSEDDDESLHDILQYQREISRLTQELEEERAECERWRVRAIDKENAGASRIPRPEIDKSHDSQLDRIKELEEILRREADIHQQEIRTMQTMHDATVSRYQEEVRKMKQSASTGSSPPPPETEALRILREDLNRIQSELDASKEQLRTRARQLQAQKKQLDELNIRMQETELELKEEKKSSAKLHGEIDDLKMKNAMSEKNLQYELENLKKVYEGVANFLSATGSPSEVIGDNVLALLSNAGARYLQLVARSDELEERKSEDQVKILQMEAKVSDLLVAAESSIEKSTSGEGAKLPESDNLNNDEDAGAIQRIQTGSEEEQKRGKLPPHLELGSPLNQSSPLPPAHRGRRLQEEEDLHQEAPPGDLTLTLQALQRQVEDYELEIEQYEQIQSEWQQEKESLQGLLNRYQNEVAQPEQQTTNKQEDERAASVAKLQKEMLELREARGNLEKEKLRLVQEKEQLQVATRNLEEELNSSISEAQAERGQLENLKQELEEHIKEKQKLEEDVSQATVDLNESRMEKEELGEALEALDSQHQEEMSQLLLVRDSLKKQVQTVQNQLELEKAEKEKNSIVIENLEKKILEMQENRERKEFEEEDELLSVRKSFSEENEKLEHKITEFETEIRNLKSENEKTVIENENMKQHFKNLREEREKLEKTVSALEEEIQERKKDGEDLVLKLEEVKGECSSVENQLEEKTKQLRESLEKLKVQEEVIGRSQEMEEILLQKDQEIQILQLKLKEDQDVIRKEEESKQHKDESASEKESKIQILERKISELNKLLLSKDESIRILEATKDSHNNLEKEEESLSHQINQLEKEVRILRSQLDEKEKVVESLLDDKKKLEGNLTAKIIQLQEENENLGLELENSGKDIAEIHSKHEEELAKIRRENQDALEETKKKFVNQEENRNAIQLESDATIKVYVEKIAHLEKLRKSLQEQLEEAEKQHAEKLESSSREMKTQWESQLARVQKDNDDLVKNLKLQNESLSEQFKILVIERDELRSGTERIRESLKQQLRDEKDLREASQRNLSASQADLLKSRESENAMKIQLSALGRELSQAKEQIARLNEKITTVEHSAPDQHNFQETDNFKLQVQKIKAEYDTRVESLMREIRELKSRMAFQSSTSNNPNFDLDQALEEIRRRDIANLEKSDLSKEDIGSLLQLIRERDEVITLLTHQRSTTSRDSTASLAEIKKLEDENRSLVLEKDQILSVITDKTKENKRLKDESHRMMNIIAEEKAALAKVQQENASLLAKYEGYDREMTKEAVGKLSRLVQEKELEIESLKQKCGTLLEVLQQQAPSGGSATVDLAATGQQVQSLLHDKEILSQQVQQLLTERNHLVALLNQRQAEVEQSRNEVVKATEALERDADNNSKLQISFSNLVHNYDQTQMKLRTVQKELAGFKEKLNHLEETKEVLITKLEVLDADDSQNRLQNGSDKDSSVNSQNEVENVIPSKKSPEMKDAERERIQIDMREKDLLIRTKTEENANTRRDLAAKTNEVEILRKSVENLREQVAGLSKNCENSRSELRTITSRLAEKEAESQAFQETNGQLSMLLKEKEYEVENAKDKCRRLESFIRENQEVMLSLKQRKLEVDKYSEESRILREKETKLESELARLRNHLIQVEEAYTQEAMLAEDREKVLAEQLQKIQNSSSAAMQANEYSQQQVESLQEQLRSALGQRDSAIQQFQLAQEQGMQYASALQKLQVAVERMQREEAATFAEQMSKVKSQLDKKMKEASGLESQVRDLKEKLENANEVLESASRLNKQLELKEENIEQLKSIVAEKQLQIDDFQDKIHHMRSKNEAMVDKELLKNLVIGYFTSPTNKQHDVLRLITGVLDCSPDEVSKMESGGSQGAKRGWIGGWLWRGGAQTGPSASAPTSPRSGTNESFTQMFVKFLENESVPHQTARLPTASMVNEAQQKMNQRRAPRSPGLSSVPTPVGTTASERVAPSVAGRYSPFLLTSASTSTPLKGQNPMSSLAGTQPLVMHPITPILPTFSPITNPSASSEREILQDILHSKTER